MAPHGNEPPAFGNQEGPDLSPPGAGYKLYRHKDVEKMKTKNWHGYYWARRNEDGDYEIRPVTKEGEAYSVPGGVMPKEGFQKHYERVAPGDRSPRSASAS